MRDYVYVNMDISLIKNGGRKAVKITKEQFIKKMHKLHLNDEDGVVSIDKFTEKDFNYWCITENKKIEKDLTKISFDYENNYIDKEMTPVIDENVPNMLGLNTLGNGLTYLGCMAGGDWEYPVFFIVYYDGKAFRGYIPTYGNCINLDFKTAFGSEGEYGDIDEETVLKGDKYKDYDEDNECLSDCYMKAQGIDSENNAVVVNWQAVQKDIESRIVIS